MLDALVHLCNKCIDAPRYKIFSWQQRVTGEEGLSHRTMPASLAELFHDCVFNSPNLCHALCRLIGIDVQSIGFQPFDPSEHLLGVRTIDRREVANQHGQLTNFVATAKMPARGRRGSTSVFVIAELEIHLVYIRSQLEAIAELLREVMRLLLCPAARKAGSHDQPGPAFLLERVIAGGAIAR